MLKIRLYLFLYLTCLLLPLFLAACSTNDPTSEDLPSGIRDLERGRFGLTVEGDPEVQVRFTGKAYYGVDNSSGETVLSFLLISEDDPDSVVDFRRVGSDIKEGKHRIGSTLERGKYIARYFSPDTSKTYVSQSGGLTIFQIDDETLGGQFHFAAVSKGDSSFAAPIGSFKAKRTSNIDKLMNQFIPRVEQASKNVSRPSK